MKSSQFFKIYKSFYKKREKTVFYLAGYFMKPVEMAVNNFLFNRSFCSQDFFYFARSFTAQFLVFDVMMPQEISRGETGNDK